MVRRILSVIKTETPYQINRSLESIAHKNNLLNQLNHTRKIDYKTAWWFNKMNPHLKQVAILFLQSYRCLLVAVISRPHIGVSFKIIKDIL
jgi:hypothetical protein